jgi:hypothetical protein
MATEVPAYAEAIDCADLALLMLARYAARERLNVRLRYLRNGRWRTYDYAPGDNADGYTRRIMISLGALNIIDNTEPIGIAEGRAGDFIMSRWDGRLGHTRVITSVTPQAGGFNVVWYQGNLPPVVPERREAMFAAIEGVFGNRPRRWRFASFG